MKIASDRRNFVASLGYAPEVAKDFALKFKSLRHNGPLRGTPVEMDFNDYVLLAKEAEITDPSQIGKGLEKFQLGRINDEGSYRRGNCRFITQRLNLMEQRENMSRRTNI